MSGYRIDILTNHLRASQAHSNLIEAVNMAGQQSPLTTHVLDTALGRPAAELPITLYSRSPEMAWLKIAAGKTNQDGRCPGLLTQETFHNGVYKIHFDTGTYHKALDTPGFYPYVEVVFEIHDPNQHYHVPLLLSPFSYSTYRGS
ncbi:transthyretin-like protein [Saccoglossus kowalevskii]|uniref:5-hydroxyisourate hydrolase n=1 Tax=Saccoglossus kowalevskii TaxID=10224 RepID=D1LXG7_SACKO|nr:transthyretin-like protein [Saccoglossus kowalevskii]ACY92673.1 transthyretin-like protein [Saccoglossus kowalevskii]